MTRVRARGEEVRRFILNQVENHPSDIAKVTAERFGITRQAVNKHLQRLASEGALTETGQTRSRVYRLGSLTQWQRTYRLVAGLAEDVVWRNDIRPALGELPGNVVDIWHYGFTEMFNNAIDHSGGTEILVHLRTTAVTAEMSLLDNGVGIFRKLQTELDLFDERHAVLELAKGKLTTDPQRHTGEGIFFTSRMFDSFDILSGGVHFTHQFDHAEDWIFERDQYKTGTRVRMRLNNRTARTVGKIFDQYSSGENYGFNKTVVPVKLAQYGDDRLVSRSQAKRILARIELFKIVVFDFEGVDAIGQAFADEVFRVFAQAHPDIEITARNANVAVKKVIDRARHP